MTSPDISNGEFQQVEIGTLTTEGKNSQNANILSFEDNPGDRRLFQEAFGDRDTNIMFNGGGRQAIQLLGQIRQQEIPRPGFILLDLNMPTVDGFDILAEINSDAELRSIPVVVFSGSWDKEDMDRAYELGASLYLVKSMDVDEYLNTLEMVSELYLSYMPRPR